MSPKTDQSTFIGAVMNADLEVPKGLVDPQGRVSEKRFNIYRNNVIVSLTEAIEAGFPVCAKITGADFFKALARAYVTAHPPASPLMIHYGDNFADFIAGFPPAQTVPYLADIARIEFAKRQSYYAADDAPLPAGWHQTVKPEALANARLTLAPAVFVLASPFPIHSIWNYNHGGPSQIVNAPEEILIYRDETDVHVTSAPVGTFACAQALLTAPFGEALASLGEVDIGQIVATLIPHISKITETTNEA